MSKHSLIQDLKGRSDTRTALLGAGLGAGAAILGIFGRKLAMQATTMLAGDWDEALAAEHKATLAVFDKLLALGPKDTVRCNLLLGHLKHALSRHALEEENAIYPAMRDAGLKPDADKLNADHGYVKQYLYDLTNITDPESFQSLLKEFRKEISRHIKEEETMLFPRLKARLDADANKALTIAMNKEGLKLA